MYKGYSTNKPFELEGEKSLIVYKSIKAQWEVCIFLVNIIFNYWDGHPSQTLTKKAAFPTIHKIVRVVSYRGRMVYVDYLVFNYFTFPIK